jgi:hypothetical protein
MPVRASTLPKTYSSAIDWWVAVLLILAPVVSAIAGVYAVGVGQADAAILLFLTGAITAAFTAVVVFPCRYTLLGDSLTIRSGIFVYRLNWDEVLSAEKSSSWASGPALSLCRVALKTNRKTYLISPKNRDAFLEDVTALLRPSASDPSDSSGNTAASN